MPSGHHHRSGGLRQSNKKNKRSKASKRSVDRAAGGKVAGKKSSVQAAAAQNKADRRNIAQQKRQAQKQALLRQKRGLDGVSAAPRIVGILSLGGSSAIEERVRDYIVDSADYNTKNNEHSLEASVSANFAVHKKDGNLTVLTASTAFASSSATNNDDDIELEPLDNNDSSSSDHAAVMSALDMARICDVLLVVLDANEPRPDNGPEGIVIGDDARSVTTATYKTSATDKYMHLISTRGDKILQALKAQGLPATMTLLAHTSKDIPDDLVTMQSVKSLRRAGVKRQLELKNFVSRFATTEFGTNNDKVMEVDLTVMDDEDVINDDVEDENVVDENMVDKSTAAVANNDDASSKKAQLKAASAILVRSLCTMSCGPAKWVSQFPRTYLVSDTVHYNKDMQTLAITGYVRGMAPLDVNSLVHVPSLGTFKCKSVRKSLAPLAAMKNPRHSTMYVDEKIVNANAELQDSLDMFASPDALDGEQNLIGFDADEYNEDNNEADLVEEERFVRPAGWSDYQAAWLDAIDDDEVVEGGDDADRGELADELNRKTLSDNASVMPVDAMDLDDANDVTTKERSTLMEMRKKEQSEHEKFPDEVQVNEDEKASERFARYRSLKSFKKSHWDPKENLPDTYASIYHFSNFKTTQRAVMNDMKELIKVSEETKGHYFGASETKKDSGDVQMDGESDDDGNEGDMLEGCVPSGSYVTLTLCDVSAEQMRSVPADTILVAVSLLPHENKISVIHTGLSRTSPVDASEDDIPIIKSKDVLTFRCGWRTWKARPVFSQNNLNCDKHKLERYMPPPGAFFAASLFGPITYTPCPVLVFRENEQSVDAGMGESTAVATTTTSVTRSFSLVASGSVMTADADRIVVKRVVLTGFPVRVHKRHATVKYMFYTPDDVRWFKPAGLYTKHGLQGHITDSIGDHGTMKCLFNAPVKQHDTVCLPLYKRVYPKFVNDSDGSNDAVNAADDKSRVMSIRPTYWLEIK